MSLERTLLDEGREEEEVKQNFEKRLCMLEAYAIQNRENISMMSASIFRMTGEIQPLFGTIREAYFQELQHPMYGHSFLANQNTPEEANFGQ